MKILWFIENLCLGGQQTQSLNLIKEIRKKSGYTVDLIYLNDGDLKIEFASLCYNVYHLKEFQKGSYRNPFKVLRLFNSYDKFQRKNNF